MKKFLRTFPIISWLIIANIASAILYFSDINLATEIYHLIGIKSVPLYITLDNLGKIILLPTCWEFFVFKSECRPDGGCYTPVLSFEYELLTFFFLDLFLIYIRKCLILAIKWKKKSF